MKAWQDYMESKLRMVMYLAAILVLFSLQPAGLGYAANLFVTTAGSGTACTQPQPCSLQTALSKASSGDAIYVAAGTYTGTGDNVVELSQDILLYGGWDGASSGPLARNPKLHVTVLDGEDARRVVYIAQGASPTIDGFTITRGNATGLITDCSGSGGKPDGCGGGIFAYQASPSITNNLITANVATYTTQGYPTATTGYGGGIYLRACTGALVSDNTISENIASKANLGQGGGIYFYGYDQTSAILDNKIIDNVGTTTTDAGWGGGVSIASSHLPVKGNTIEGNVASKGGSSQGSGLYQWQGSAPIQENTIAGNSRGSAVYLGHSYSTVERNYIWDNDVDEAIRLLASPNGKNVTLVNNVVVGSGLYVVYAEGHETQPLSAVLKHNTLVAAAASYGVYAIDHATITMINNIVTGCAVSGNYVADGTSSIAADHNLFYDNAADGERGTNPVDGNPLFRNAAGLDYRLRAGSAAIDAGTDAGITIDVEGRPRPMKMGYDIGAYELASGFTPGINMLLLDN
ncbi:MAG: right-handed parallel beta-helix repeat-containing protein [Deltaproteobacteria bacterium]|nr:right-handed parallel beta-helix repeat-containing protein [Deltaproteobacteria bacterium]MBW2072786.1 right-handed parallel beta-helix repeat-containing protein [Deltaproteobacteria bacterium]